MKALFVALLFAPSISFGATYYFASAGTGANGACVAGNDANAGTNPALPKATLAGITGGPHTFKFARGCAWNNFQRNLTSTTGSKANPNIYEDYPHPSFFPNQDSGTASGTSSTTIADSSKSWTVNAWVGYTIYTRAPHWQNADPHCTAQVGVVTSNTATTLTVASWKHPNQYETCTNGPQAGSTYKVQGAKPRLNSADSSVAMWNAENSGAAALEQGFVVRGFEMVGYSVGWTYPFTYRASYALRVQNVAAHITVDDSIIRQFNVATDIRLANSGSVAGFENGKSQFITVQNSVITDNKTQGSLGGGDWTRYENNWYDLNGWGSASGRDHNLYISSRGDNIIVRGNTMTRAARHTGGTSSPLVAAGGPANYACAGIAFVSHGEHKNLIVEENFIYESNASGGCYAIDLNGNSSGSYPATSPPEDFSNLVIRSNLIVFENRHNLAIGCSSCPGALIENNTIVNLGTSGSGSAIVAPSTLSEFYWNGDWNNSGTFPDALTCPSPNQTYAGDVRCDVLDDRPIIRNNTIWIASGSSSAVGITYLDNSLQGQNADDLVIVGNLVYFTAAHPSAKCFNYGGRSSASFVASGSNLCFSAGSNQPTWYEGGNLATAQAAGLESGSLASNPQISATPSAANFWRVTVNSGSPAINAGHASKSSQSAARRLKPDSQRDIGAEEFGATVTLPQAPTGARAQ